MAIGNLTESVSSNALARLRGLLNSLSPSERKIGEYILENHEKIPQLTLAEVAQESGVSDATAVRFFRAVGYKRWLDLKIALSLSTQSTSYAIHEEIHPEDSSKEITQKVINGAITALLETAAVLDANDLDRALGLIQNADKILIVGGGTSGPVTQEMFNRMFRLGLNCSVETDSYLQVMQSALLTANDVMIAISQTGESDNTLRTVRVAKKRDCPVICITGNRLSDLAKLSDAVLLSVSHEMLQETTASRIAQYALVHALYINLAVRESDQALRNERIIWDALVANYLPDHP